MNKITELFGIKYPVIQAGMIWCSGWKLASAVSNSGGLGLIGSGSMHPETFREHVKKCKSATEKPFGVNVPLKYPQMADIIKIIIDEKIPIVFTSAGNPKSYTPMLKDKGIKVVHVVSSVKFAVKCEEAGVDAIVAEGFEAGGHNGIEETTTFVLIPMIRKSISLPLIAAGGIGTGRAMLAAFILGADGVQIGSRFAASTESSAHDAFKQKILEAAEGDTRLMMKKHTPVRLLKNKFFDIVSEAEDNGATKEDLIRILGKGKAKLGMFEGNIDDGELEIGQVSSLINNIQSASDIMNDLIAEYNAVKADICNKL